MAESGDVENPTTGAASNPHYTGGSVTNKNWKAIALSAFLVAAVTLAIALGVTLGKENSETTASNNINANNNGETIDEPKINTDEPLVSSSAADNATLTNPTVLIITEDEISSSSLDLITLVGPTWYVKEFFDGDKLITPLSEGTPMSLQFQEDGIISGNNGCKNTSYSFGYFDLTDASFTVEGNVVVSQATICNNDLLRKQQKVYLKLFKGRNHMSNDQVRSPIIDYTIDTEGGTLELRDGSTVMARYTNAAPANDGTTPEGGGGTGSIPTNPAFEVQYLQSDGPISSRVRIANPGVANGYSSCQDLTEDIRNALRFYANSIIVRDRDNDWISKCNLGDACTRDDHCRSRNCTEGQCIPGHYDPGTPSWSPTFGATPTVGTSLPDPDDGTASGPSDIPAEDSFDTNTQVDGVDEADIVKANANYVFAAYGDIIWTWNSTDATEGMSPTQMPREPRDPNCTEHMPGPSPSMWTAFPTPAPDDIMFVSRLPTSPSEDVRRGRNLYHQRKVSVMPWYNSCDKPKPRILSLLLAGPRLAALVSESDDNYWGHSSGESPSIISDEKIVLRVYDAENIPTDGGPLTLLGEQQIQGTFTSARSIGSKGVVISNSNINLWPFISDLGRYNSQYCGRNATEYEALAMETALGMIDNVTEQIVEELALQNNDDGTCDNFFQIAAMQTGNSTDSPNSDLLGMLVQVTTFDMSSDFGGMGSEVPPKIPVNAAAAFASGISQSVYASQDFAASVNVGYGYNPSSGKWDSATFIQGFDISGLTPKPFSYAELPGAPLNQYSLDLYQNHLRVVTTQSQWWPERKTTNKLWVLQVPDRGPTIDVGMANNPKMELTGETGHLGKPNEEVFAVRFMGDLAYAVTFEQTDPFYVLNVTNPTNPIVIGELQIPGFSSYLHPIEINGIKMMIGVGRYVDPLSGRDDGAKISLFDVSNPTNPLENATHVDMGAYSSASNDFYSFRYLQRNQKIILPTSNTRTFDGFVVYDVKLGSITSSYEIQHADSHDMRQGCWYEARMPARSLVFQSQLTTILSHSVVSTNLGSGIRNWNVSLDEGLNKTECREYFW